jgi:hypothetical protein
MVTSAAWRASMARKDCIPNRWLKFTLALALADDAFVIARPGLAAVVLWYVALLDWGAAATLPGFAPVQWCRHREAPAMRARAG